jgi:hypothetical protein
VSLVIEIEAVADELFDFDFGRTVEAAIVRGAVATITSVASATVVGASAAVASAPGSTSTVTARAVFARRAVFSVRCGCRLISH